MNKVLLTLAMLAAMALAAPAMADDSNWAGSYAGLNAGWSFGNSHAHTSTVFNGAGYFAASSVTSIANSGSQNLSSDGFTGGAQLGFNRQSGNIVYGFETDFGAFDAHDSKSTTTVYPCCGPTNYTINQSVDTDWLLTMRPRIGYSTGNLLIYGTGGLSVTNIKYKERFTDTFANALETSSQNTFKAGWNLGAGVEYKVMSNWSVKGEYLYTDFGNISNTSNNLTETSGGNPALNTFSHSANLSSNVIRVGFNYQF